MMIAGIVVLSWFLLAGLLVRRRNARRRSERTEIDDLGVRRTLGDGRVESITWAELVRVEVLTTDEGPYAQDFFFLLFAGDGQGCVVPNDQSQGLLPRLQALPGFDNTVLVSACGSTQNARFVCWVAPPPIEAPPHSSSP